MRQEGYDLILDQDAALQGETAATSKKSARSTVRMLGLVRRTGEYVSAAHGYIFLGGTLTSAVALATSTTSYLTPTAPYMVPVLSVVVLAMAINSRAATRKYRLAEAAAAAREARLRERATQILEELTMRREQALLQQETDKRRIASGHHLTVYEAENARCDKELFTALCRFLESDKDRSATLDHATLLVEQNIRFVLDTLCAVLQNVTGSPCAASVKIICDWGTGTNQLAGAKLRTVYRDTASQGERNKDDCQLFAIDENTATKRVLIDGETYFACDDLLEAVNRGEYKNARTGWARNYNSTAAVPIASLAEDLGVPRYGMLLVDSPTAKLNNTRCKSLMVALSWRLAIMLLRIKKLRELSQPPPSEMSRKPKK